MKPKGKKPTKKEEKAEEPKLSREEIFEQREAINALGREGGAEAVKALIKALRNSSPAVRSTAAHWLGEIGGGSASEALLRARTDYDPNVRLSVSLAIRKMLSRSKRKHQK
jgi:HEAT repeat protein